MATAEAIPDADKQTQNQAKATLSLTSPHVPIAATVVESVTPLFENDQKNGLYVIL
jgi:hypothetical protein